MRSKAGSRLGYAALFLASACSVYTSELVDDMSPIITGGSSATAGTNSSTAGKPGSNGGTGEDPSVGGEAGQGDGGPGGEGGSTSGGSTSGAGGGSSGATPGGSTAGGTSGTAGSSGTGGTVNLDDVLDGFEDNDLTLEQVQGRGGVWYTFHDATTGTMTPSPLACSPLADAPAELGQYAMHITATGFSSYGSGLGTDFRAGKKLYDASQYTGIKFWAKVGASKNARHRVQLADINTDAAGMECDPAGKPDSGTQCEDHFGKEYAFTPEWKQYTLTFAEAAQLGWGFPGIDSEIKLQAKSLYGLQITAKKSLAVDLWIDQIEFY